MPATCQPLPRTVAEQMLQVVARALCDHPGDKPAQRDSRANQLVHSTLGFEPRDGLEYMLSTLVFGHFNMILNSMHDVVLGQLDTMKTKTKTTIVALDRSMLGLVRELRLASARPLAKWAEDVKRAQAEQEAAAAATPPDEAIPPDEPPQQPSEAPPPAVDVPAAPVAAARTVTRPAARPHVPAPPMPAMREAGQRMPTVSEIEQHMAEFQQALDDAHQTLADVDAIHTAKQIARTAIEESLRASNIREA